MLDTERLWAALVHDEDLVCVLRGHLYIDAELNKFIESALVDPTQLKQLPRKPWNARLELALALGLSPGLGPPLKKFGDIRNDFAHDPDTVRISDERVKELYGTLGDGLRSLVMRGFKVIRTQAIAEGAVVPDDRQFADLIPKARFGIIVVALCSALHDAVT